MSRSLIGRGGAAVVRTGGAQRGHCRCARASAGAGLPLPLLLRAARVALHAGAVLGPSRGCTACTCAGRPCAPPNVQRVVWIGNLLCAPLWLLG